MMQTSVDKFMKLFEINKLLTKTLDLDFVLRTLVKSANELIDTSDTIILTLYDNEKGALSIVEGIGIDKKVMKQISFLPGESMTGMTFLKKKSMLFSRTEDVNQAMSTMSSRNYQLYIEGVNNRQIKSVFCVPLLYQQDCLGVLVVDNFESEHHFTEEEMMIVEVIANQSAIAIINARLVEDLRKKNNLLLTSIDIHQKFTKLVLEGGEKERILSMLSGTLNCNAMYKDTDDLEEGYSHFSIIGENEVLGFIHYKKEANGLSPLEKIALEHASTALALKLMKENALYEHDLYLREQFFQEMAEGISLAQLKNLTRRLQWQTDWNYVCLVLEGDKDPLWNQLAMTDKKRFVKSIESSSRSVCSKSFVFTTGQQLIIVSPVFKENIPEKIVKIINNQWGNSRKILFGIGRQTTLHKIGESLIEAKEAIRYGKMKGDQLIFYPKLGAERLWQKVDPLSLENYVADQLDPLFSMGKEYEETLFKLIQLNKNHKDTANALNIHQNTLYYRLKKIEEALGVSLDNTNDWLNIILAFQIYCDKQQI